MSEDDCIKKLDEYYEDLANAQELEDLLELINYSKGILYAMLKDKKIIGIQFKKLMDSVDVKITKCDKETKSALQKVELSMSMQLRRGIKRMYEKHIGEECVRKSAGNAAENPYSMNALRQCHDVKMEIDFNPKS